MSRSDDDELSERLGALRVDPPDTGFLGRLHDALEAEAAARSSSSEDEEGALDPAAAAELDARLSLLRTAPPDDGFERRLRIALEREAAEASPPFPALRSWIVRVAIVLLAILAPVAVYAAGMRLVQAFRAAASSSEPVPPRPAAPPAERAPTRAPRPVRHRAEPPAIEAPRAIAPPAPIERLAPSRERLRAAPAAGLESRPELAPSVEAAPAEAAPLSPIAAPTPTPPAPPIERLRIDPRAPHREGELRAMPRELGERPPIGGSRDGRGSPPGPTPPAGVDAHRPPPEGTGSALPPRDATRPPPDRLPPRERALPPPGERPMPPPDRPPPLERPMRLP